jgi:hypothetical protein
MKTTRKRQTISGIVTFLFLVSILMGYSQIPGYIDPPNPPQNYLHFSRQSGPDFPVSSSFLLNGSTYFSNNIQVNTDVNNLIDDFGPAAAVLGDTVYVVWNGDESVKSIYFARSVDGGIHFSIPIRINDTVTYPPGFSVYQPDLTVDANGHIYVVWHDYRAWTSDTDYGSPIDIFLDKSVDGGLTWGNDVQVSIGTGTYPWHFQPYIAMDKNNGNIYVSFTDYDRYGANDFGDVSLTGSTDGGQNFLPKIRVDDTPEFSLVVQEFSDITVDQNNGHVYVVFQDNRNGSRDIYLTKSIDAGSTIGTNIKVNTVDSNDQEEPAIAIHPKNGDVLVTWKDWRADPTPDSASYDNHIYVARSVNGAQSFSPGVVVTDQFMNAQVGFNFPPDITVDSFGVIYVVWHDSRLGFSNVYYDQSIDGGMTFGNDLIINNNMDTLTHTLPRIASDPSGKTYVVWLDRRNQGGSTNADIFLAGSGLESCEANLMITGSILTDTYRAGITLKSDGFITISENVVFQAGYSILLEPNFTLETGAQFEINIAGCDDP